MALENLSPDEIAAILNEYNEALAKGTPISQELADSLKDAQIGVKNYTATLKSNVSQLGTSFAKAAGDIAKGAEGASVFNDGLKSLANVTSTLLSRFGPLGIAAGLAVKGLEKWASAANEQADSLFKSYQELSRSGLATGMQDTFKNLQDMGYTMKEIGNMAAVMKDNADILAQFGGTAATGSKQFAIMAKDIQYSDLGTQFKRMGMSVDDINNGIAGYMKLQQSSGTLQKKTADEMAASAAAYIEEQDRITKITGASAKEQQAALEQAMSDQRFNATQRKLEQAGDAQSLAVAKRNRELYNIYLKQGGPELAKGFADVASGFSNSKEAQKFQRTFGSSTDMIRQGVTDTGKIVDESKRNAKKALDAGTTLAQAGKFNDNFTDFSQTAKFSNQAIGQSTEEALKQAEDQQKAQKDGADDQVKTMVDLTTAQRNTAQTFDNLVNKGIGPATTASKLFAETLDGATDVINSVTGRGEKQGGESTSLWGKLKSTLSGTPSTPAAAGGAAGAYGAKGGSVGGGGGPGGAVGGSQAQLQIKNAQGQLVETRKGGNINWRNNNPGNIRYGEFAIQMGAIGQNGGFAVFPTMEMGEKAQDTLLKGKNYANLTAKQAISRWAPSSENNPEAYARSVGAQTGLDLNKRYVDMTPDEQKKFRQAMMKVEGGKAGEVIPAAAPPSPITEQKKPSAALGGVLSGAKSGFDATLHGTEAVVPLPDGKTIPVNVKSEDRKAPAAFDQNIIVQQFSELFGKFEKIAQFKPQNTVIDKTASEKPFNIFADFGIKIAESFRETSEKSNLPRTQANAVQQITDTFNNLVKTIAPRSEAPKPAAPKAEESKPAVTTSEKPATPKAEAPKPAVPKAEEPKAEAPKPAVATSEKPSIEEHFNKISSAITQQMDQFKNIVGPNAKTTESYTVNGKPADKATYDKFMSDHPDLTKIQEKLTQPYADLMKMMPESNALSGPTSNFKSTLDNIQSKIPAPEDKKAEPKTEAQPRDSQEQLHLMSQQLTKLDTIINTLTKSNTINNKILQRQS